MDKIVLIGMPGSGKTTLGKELTQSRKAAKVVDTDTEVEKTEQLSISNIFRNKGEQYFRDVESKILEQQLCGSASLREILIISTGGGIVLRQKNIDLMREHAFVIFIDRPIDEIIESVTYNNDRPLLGSKDDLLRLYNERIDLYRNATHVTISNNIEELEMVIQLSGAYGNYAVVGDPIAHSISPELHNNTFKKLDINEHYFAALIKSKYLNSAMKTFRAGSMQGLNVTIPHKLEMAKLVDELKDDAITSRAVNTVVKKNGKLYGYNTDMEGLKRALSKQGVQYKDSNIIVIGSGGAAMGIVQKAQDEGAASITIFCRHPERISRKAASACMPQVQRFSILCDFAALREINILINATPLGMQGYDSDFDDLSFIKALPKDAFVCDLVYNPPETKLLKAARAAGLRCCNGYDMLVNQALIADELFLGGING
ncbi:MAG: shikimate dehydrogenase [Spirochaetaceae bacterium]|jgi:shikimate dehydrogenase|nr:shikimate dehydrogenase [Spirochaetaceae bacterium]